MVGPNRYRYLASEPLPVGAPATMTIHLDDIPLDEMYVDDSLHDQSDIHNILHRYIHNYLQIFGGGNARSIYMYSTT